MNIWEISRNIIHADGADGDDHTLCGVTSEKEIPDMSEYDRERESELVPYVMKTRQKITCPKCAAIIRHCCTLGRRSIGEVREFDLD